jgi:glutamyl-tRNA reductase
MADSPRAIVCIGVSHHTASLAVRERLALSGPGGEHLCRELAADAGVLEVAALATCNRSELYLVTTCDHLGRVDEHVIDAFARMAGVSIDELATVLTVRERDAATEHLFRVAGGIESVVTGEAQIQGQLRDAHQRSRDAGTCGPVLDRLFCRAVELGKRARTETRIGAGRASIGSVAAELVASQRNGSLDDALILVVGAGKMGGLAARSLAQRGARRIDVVNRNLERANHIAECSGAEGMGITFGDIEAELERCDAVVSCTNAPHVVIGLERMQRVMQVRRGRPITLVDLAVPRDIDAACSEIDGVHAFDLDDLERVVAQTLDVRCEEIEAVEQLAADATQEFDAWLRALAVTPQIRKLRDQAEQLRSSEVERALARMPHLEAADRERIEQLTRTLVKRMLHEPTMQLRRAAEHGG